MSEEKDINLEQSYIKYPFLKKLDKDDSAKLMAAILILVLAGPKSGDSLMHALKAIITEGK